MRVLPGAVTVHFFVLVGELVDRFELQQIRHFTDDIRQKCQSKIPRDMPESCGWSLSQTDNYGQSVRLCGLFLGHFLCFDSICEDDPSDYLVKEPVAPQASPMFFGSHQ